MYNRSNPWADMIFGQVLMCRLVVDAAIKAFVPQYWVKVDAGPDAFLPRCEPRLDPLEFHGRRRSGFAAQKTNQASGSVSHGSDRIDARRRTHDE